MESVTANIAPAEVAALQNEEQQSTLCGLLQYGPGDDNAVAPWDDWHGPTLAYRVGPDRWGYKHTVLTELGRRVAKHILDQRERNPTESVTTHKQASELEEP